MTAEFGVFFLIIALLVSLLQTVYLLPFSVYRGLLARISPLAAWLQCFCITAALATLIILRLDSDFSVANVLAHSNLSLPTLYKIAGAWGNHEGSMLLWVFVLALFGALLGGGARGWGLGTREYAVAIQSALCAGMLSFILFTSNPFERRFPPTTDGEALNPLLQDMALSIHPPLLYLGYVGFSIVFSLAVAALIVGRADRAWSEIIHPWIMASWSALTFGIGLGSWWAYRELGWGGWWFWDPVENSSLLPWLSGTALLHSNILLKKRGILAPWVVLLSIITFALSLLGTFLVRSGAITSVHSFASDPARGVFILAYIFLAVGGALLLYSFRASKISSETGLVAKSREGMMIINNLFILSACATVLLGTLYPIFAEVFSGEKITVGAPYFEATFTPIMAASMIFAGITPFLAWKKADFRSSLRQMRGAIIATVTLVLLVVAFAKTKIFFACVGFSISGWLLFASIFWLRSAKGVAGRYAVFFAHFGAAVLAFGVTGSSLWKEEVQGLLATGDKLHIAGYYVLYASSEDIAGENYTAKKVKLVVDGGDIILFPEYRTYLIRGSKTSETAIYSGVKGDLYGAIGETSKDGKVAIRLYFQPIISLIWLGFVLMTIGGIMSILNKRWVK